MDVTQPRLASSRFSPGQLLMAVDGGGSKTSCYVARVDSDGSPVILGHGLASGSNPRTIGIERAAEAILTSVRQAYSSAGLVDDRCERALLAIAGTLEETPRKALAKQLEAQRIARELTVIPDLFVLLPPAGQCRAAVGIIAGTGSVGVGRNQAGDLAVVGGWGSMLGDDGSGFAIGRSAIRGTLARLESNQTLTPMDQAVCGDLEAFTAGQIKSRLATAEDPRHLVSQLAAVVLKEAGQENRPAQVIVEQAAIDLAELVVRLCAKLKLDSDPIQMTVVGGLFQAGDLLQSRLIAALGDRGITGGLTRITDPAEACLRLLVQGGPPQIGPILP